MDKKLAKIYGVLGLDVVPSGRKDQHSWEICCPHFEESASWFLWQINTVYQMTESLPRKKK